jgi:hypothetical protein
MELITSKTPGQAGHDTWCELDDWDLLEDDERALWEDAIRAGHDRIVAIAAAEQEEN